MLSRAGGVWSRLVAWADAFQQRHAAIGFPYAVIKKYGDDGCGRHAALLTYYGFLGIFPLALLAASVLSRVLENDQALRQRMIDEIVPLALRPTVEDALTSMPSSGLPLALGILGLLLAGTGVVFSAYETLNHLAGVPIRARFGFFARYARAAVVLLVVLAGGVGVALLTVGSGAIPQVSGFQNVVATVGASSVAFGVLVVAGKLLVARPVQLRVCWPAAALGALTVATVLTLGTRLLAAFVTEAGAVYGTFATVAGGFSLLFLVSRALLYSAEVAVVRHDRLWPRALDDSRPTPADVRVLTRLATEQERLEGQRIESRFSTT